MRRFAFVFFVFFSNFFIASAASIFQNREFYLELLNRVPPDLKPVLIAYLNTPLFLASEDQRVLFSLRKIEEKKIFSSWKENEAVFQAFVSQKVLLQSEERRYYYLRESFRQASRSVVDKEIIENIQKLLKLDFLALISDMQMRLLLVPLIQNGFMKTYFQVVYDLILLKRIPEFSSRWEKAYRIRRQNLKDSQARIETMMKLAQDYSESALESARRIRDSGLFELWYSPDNFQRVESDYFRVFEKFFMDGELAFLIQYLARKGILMKTLEDAESSSRENLKRVTLEMKNVESGALQKFKQSQGFLVFQDPDVILDLYQLQGSGVLEKLANSLDFLVRMNSNEYGQFFSQVDEFFSLEQKKRKKEKRVWLKKKRQEEICYENMDKMMKMRERYSLLFRKDLDLSREENRKDFFSLFKEELYCPTGSQYRTSSYHILECPVHGKAKLMHNE